MHGINQCMQGWDQHVGAARATGLMPACCGSARPCVHVPKHGCVPAVSDRCSHWAYSQQRVLLFFSDKQLCSTGSTTKLLVTTLPAL